MVRKYKLQINDNTLEVEVEGPDHGTFKITVGETTFPVHITNGDRVSGKYKVTVGETNHFIQVTLGKGTPTHFVELNKQTFSATLQPIGAALPMQRRAYTASTTLSTPTELTTTTQGIVEAEEPGTVTAPLPGRVLEVRVKPSQQILAGDVLLVLEAMKMANEIRAPYDGIIHKIHVENGAAVEKGQALVTIR